ncbi:exosortase-dependent surface protein XDP1 [Rhodoferax sp. GW822-FHT02A01]|uniref:exosortase-dependent surface protein XDP1 n=1 Tax=Rhodoferax sp. GW822-FHT02A01 TaxID=3141537 RepID=UPI00315C76D3
MKRNIYLAIAIAIGTCGASAWASSTWSQNLVADCTSSAASQACSGSPAVSLSGWSTGSGTITNPTAGSSFAAATVYNYGSSYGLGVVASNESASATGPHATDNINGIDAMLLSFTNGPVNLSSVSIGWNGTDNGTSPYNDSDLSILAWTGSTTPPTMAGASLSGLLSSGWSLIGNFSNVGAQAGNTATSSNTSTYSSYWLISAYSTSYGPTSTNGQTLDQGNDAFKLLSVAGNTCAGTVSGSQCNPNKTPEPGSVALLGAGLLGLIASRRRFSKR